MRHIVGGFCFRKHHQSLRWRSRRILFWATEKDAELDLLVIKGEQRLGYEFKYTDAPKVTRSMRHALHDLKLDHLTIITPGERSYPLEEKISVSNLRAMIKKMEPAVGLEPTTG